MNRPPARFYVPAEDTAHAALEGRVPVSTVRPRPDLLPDAELIPHAALSAIRHAAFVAHVGLLTTRYAARVYLAARGRYV